MTLLSNIELSLCIQVTPKCVTISANSKDPGESHISNIKPKNIEKHFTPNILAWCMKPPEILFNLHSGKKSESNSHILKDDFRKMQSRYKNYLQIYTDGPKEDSKVGCAVISDNHSYMQRIPDDSSIFTAEAKAIDLALDFISTCDANKKNYYIF